MNPEIRRNIQSSPQRPFKKGIYIKYIKRPLDLILSLLAIIILSPLFLMISILVKVKLGSPILFKHRRPGLNEDIFVMYKFRTMTNEKDLNGNPLPNNLRMTKFGKLLRSTSLDELPGLFNVLRGEMSLIGPRPLLKEYLPYYDEFQKQRHLVKPGLSGLAQINGRNSITWEEKFEYDIQYVQNITFILDCKITIKTILKVFRREDINSSEYVTMERFKGTQRK